MMVLVDLSKVCSWVGNDPVGTDPDFSFRRSARPILYWPKLRKQSSVKCLAQTKLLGSCVGASAVKRLKYVIALMS